ncbi:glycoside hydrolase family 3 N-terminal domain-containing protein [Flavobacterium psychrophilum]|uniref:glycoside hydrolase family 3 N-terminal domain-containing protein n=2 Tax=Flavobacterium psychrophilum TaxID=96345 RepID=UPI000B7C32B0|nr:glycoside hydrolase family 3 N-terminal domain-containing protein [Flavobacterium psychrophilum]EKT4501064.1 serine hydrolase [Flavobacterium psychrophilum]MCB5982268.1 serine hydrolase [Flavobacterium psychrophilum]MCB5994975.1 serine hydrolase [Flavobacterium psychrophilum]MCB5997311.1 serine hydrolase [Flavobacterium psychrophilum]MCB6004528.1 serine hydrolase [Flavobacterium psychrophilum]
MKNSVFKFLLFSILTLFMVNCSVNKNRGIENIAIDNDEAKSKTEKFIDPSKVGFNLFEDNHSEKKWVDSIYNTMTFQEKLGQLFMVAAYSNKDSIHFNSLDKLIKNYKIGGLIFFQGGPVRQAKLTNRFQAVSKTPLFIGNDAEWGLSMRLDSTYRYPWNMTLGAIQDMKLIEELGEQMGKETKRMGIQFNFAPVIDINTNPNNPIIGNRSFGENKEEVTKRAVALMKGFQNQGVFSTGKHFPGHGDSETDSHHSLPIINFSKERLEDVEFYPYKKMFNLGLASVMVAHLNVPSLETRVNYPSSISYNIVTNILKKHLGFKGLIFTDALNMKGASNFKKPGEIDLEAFLAGNDILLFPEDVPTAIQKFTQAYKDTLITDDRIEFSVKKILKYKHKAGLDKYNPIETSTLYKDLNKPITNSLQYKLYENAITLLKNKDSILPINDLAKSKIAYVKLGDDSGNVFLSTLNKYAEVTEVFNENIDSLNQDLKQYTTVIIGFHKSDKAWKKHEFTEKELLWIQKIAQNNTVILDIFAKPYTLLQIKNFDNIKGLILTYQNGDIAQEVSAELIFGSIEAKGKIPVSIANFFNQGDGLTTKKTNRLGFTTPENVGMNSEILSKIDAIAKKAIDGKMTPGAQILVAKKGKVVYQKSFGYHTYKNETKVKNSDIYDVASLTKIVSTLPNVMLEYDAKKINLATTLGTMIPEARGTNKDSISFKDLLSHYARLQAWIPFYKSTLDSNKIPLKKYYNNTYSENFKNQVSENLFIRNDYNDTIIKKIISSKLLDKKEYKYSDFTFILLKEYLEKSNNQTLDVLSQENFFSKLGMNNTLYNPLRKFDISVIPPTEVDTYFRHQIIQGYVHDMGAAMQGGVGGHAGIFSNTIDIAKMMQMYLQKGNYGGIQYFSEQTFNDFNTCYFCAQGNRRGLGLDKPQLSGTSGPTCGCASLTSFGHTGFTGTMAWVDPETEIVYVFLSNRTFPDSNASNKLSKENIREDIQKIIYEAIIK